MNVRYCFFCCNLGSTFFLSLNWVKAKIMLNFWCIGCPLFYH